MNISNAKSSYVCNIKSNNQNKTAFKGIMATSEFVTATGVMGEKLLTCAKERFSVLCEKQDMIFDADPAMQKFSVKFDKLAYPIMFNLSWLRNTSEFNIKTILSIISTKIQDIRW